MELHDLLEKLKKRFVNVGAFGDNDEDLSLVMKKYNKLEY